MSKPLSGEQSPLSRRPENCDRDAALPEAGGDATIERSRGVNIVTRNGVAAPRWRAVVGVVGAIGLALVGCTASPGPPPRAGSGPPPPTAAATPLASRTPPAAPSPPLGAQPQLASDPAQLA